MKKIFSIILLSLIISGCGFSPLHKDTELKSSKYNFEIIEKSGDKEINYYITSNLAKYYKSDESEIIEININSNYSLNGISKNKKGETLVYALTITVEFDITKNNKNNKIILEDTINFNKFNNTFKQINYEKRTKEEISKFLVDRFINRLFLY